MPRASLALRRRGLGHALDGRWDGARGAGGRETPDQAFPMFQNTVAGVRKAPVTFRRHALGCQ